MMQRPPRSPLLPTPTLFRSTRNEELRAALSALWIYGGLPPDRLSALHYAMLWHSFHVQGAAAAKGGVKARSEEHTSELQSRQYLACRLLLEKNNSTALISPS